MVSILQRAFRRSGSRYTNYQRIIESCSTSFSSNHSKSFSSDLDSQSSNIQQDSNESQLSINNIKTNIKSHFPNSENNFPIPFLPPSIAATVVAQAGTNTVTTAAGYTFPATAVIAMANAPLVAFAFVQASGISPIRQILRDKGTGELSPFPFISLYTNCGIWTLYGVLNSDQTILIANVAGVIAGLIYTGIFAQNTHLSMSKYYLGSGAILSVLLSSPYWLPDTASAIQLLGSFGCASAVILMASPLSVVSTVVKNKSTEAMPFIVSLAMTINGSAWGTYGWFVTGDPYVYLPNILGCGAGLIQLSLFAIYPSKSQTNFENTSKGDDTAKLKYSRHEK